MRIDREDIADCGRSAASISLLDSQHPSLLLLLLLQLLLALTVALPGTRTQ